MLWVSLFPFFRESVEMVNVAVPLTSGTDPYVVPPSMNSTMPVGATPSEDCTLAVNVTGVFTVEDNASLTDIAGLDQLQRIDSVSIRRNPSLERIALPALGNVLGDLVVASNPTLDVSSIANLAGVVSQRTKLALNGPNSALEDPCPWANDGQCDAGDSEPLCAPSTDGVDCEPFPSEPLPP